MKQLNANDLERAFDTLNELKNCINVNSNVRYSEDSPAYIPQCPGTVKDLILELLAFGELDANIQVIVKERPYDISYAFIAGEPGHVEAIYIALGER